MNWQQTQYNATQAWFPEPVTKQRAIKREAEAKVGETHIAWRTAQREGADEGTLTPLKQAREAAIKACDAARAKLRSTMGYITQRPDGFLVFKAKNGKLAVMGKHETLEAAQGAYGG